MSPTHVQVAVSQASPVQHTQPVQRQNLADDVAQRIKELIQQRGSQAGDRLPSIAAMARHFGVGSPTLREALRKLEAVGVIDIRHGSGVYVASEQDMLVIASPLFAMPATKKLLLDLIDARIPIESRSAALAAVNAQKGHLAELRRLLTHAGSNLDDATTLNQANLAFHRQIAIASGNTVISQLLDVVVSLFRAEQLMILDIHGGRRDDHAEHWRILEAIEKRDAKLATERMRAHLEGVRKVLLRWNPEKTPVAPSATRNTLASPARRPVSRR